VWSRPPSRRWDVHSISSLKYLLAIRAADMPGADDLMMRVYAAMAQKERELISERTRAALGAAKARGARLGGDRGYRPMRGPDSGAAAVARRETAERAAHRLLLEIDRLREAGVMSMQGLARALTDGGVPTPRGGGIWTHTTVGRLLTRTGTQPAHGPR
jgi:DNA invertase Pin-like site-specific DNA recombinase